MSASEIKLEVCVDSIASAMAAADGGAARIELCAALGEGGLTPTVGALKELKKLPLNIPIFCMLRPRRGNDFVYSQLELDAVLTDMDLLRSHGADGFVFGALTAQRTIDMEHCRQVVQRADGVPVTFHRAFDLTNVALMHDNVLRLQELGFKRILSSGFRPTAAEGTEFLTELIAHHRGILIVPGAGVTVENLEPLLIETKCAEFHSSAKAAAGAVSFGNGSSGDGARMECDVSMGKQDVEPYAIADVDVVRKMVAIARSMRER